MKRTIRLTLFAVLLVGAQICLGQTSNQGTLVGTVRDQTGSVIPAATITITNNETGVGRKVTTDDRGNYRMDFLRPGSYRIEGEATGFRRTQLSEVAVEVSDIRRADINMEVGEINEQVSVTTEGGSALNTENATMGTIVNERTIQNMPLNGREFLELAALVPGAESGNGKTGVIENNGVSVGFSGARSGYNSYYVDGAESTDSYFNTLVSSPALDAIKEFRVETSLYSARYGRAGGGVISAVTKSGTNKFHGTIYEFHRNKALDALPYFQTAERSSTPPYKFNQYGGTIGGPIIKNKTFFFFSAEFFRQTKPGDLIEGIAPTAKERIGDFSETINPYNGKPEVIVDPHCVQNGSGPPYCSQTPIPGNILPAHLQSEIGKKLMALIPEPNYDDPIFNLRIFRSGVKTTDKYLIKIDHNFGDGSTLSGSYNYNIYDNVSPGIIEFADRNDFNYGKTLALGYTRTLTNTLVSDTKFSYTWSENGYKQSLTDKNYAEEFGFWMGDFKPDAVGFPRVQLYTVGNRYMRIGEQGPNLRDNTTLTAREDLVWIKGDHTFQIGGDYRFQDYGWLYDVHMFGGYLFGIFEGGTAGNNNNYRVAGNVWADLLTGISSYTNYSYGDSTLARSTRSALGLYIQDDWKVNDRLTLNLGLRYDFEQPFGSKDGKFMTVNYETGMPVYSKDVDPALIANLQFDHETGGSNRPYDANTMNFAPRLGFAYRFSKNDSTVVRGGYGLVYTSENLYTTGYGSFVAPFSGTFIWRTRARLQPDRIDHLLPVSEEPFNLPLTSPTNPGNTWANPREYPSANVQHWNLGISRDFGWGVVGELAYVGSKGTQLNGLGSLRSYDFELSELTRENVPGWNNINLRLKGFNSKYNSMQVKVTKRFSDGLSFLAAYTWAHSMAESSNDHIDESTLIDVDGNGASVLKRIYSNSDFDVRQRFSLSTSYNLPFGKGRSFGKDWNSFTNAILGGWRINMIATYQAGYPFTVKATNGRRPNRVCDGNLPASERTPDRWFDYTCFETPPVETVVIDGQTTSVNLQGNAGPNIITGPNYINFNFGLHKEFRLNESMRIQLRAEAFNAFNRPNLLGPSINNFINNASGAAITRQRDNRNVQLAAKFIF